MIVVEDGQGSWCSVSYAGVSTADAYHLSRGNQKWAEASEMQKEAALVRASSYIDAMYQFVGGPKREDQAMQWPRDTMKDESRLPAGVPNAACELALAALSEDITAPYDIVAEENIRGLITKYDRSDRYERFPLVTGFLRPYLKVELGLGGVKSVGLKLKREI